MVERLHVATCVMVPRADVSDVKVLWDCAASAAAFAVSLASLAAVHHVWPLYGNVKCRRVSIPSRIPLFALADQSLPVYIHVYTLYCWRTCKKAARGEGEKGGHVLKDSGALLAAACANESSHFTLVITGDGEVVSKEFGEGESGARGGWTGGATCWL